MTSVLSFILRMGLCSHFWKERKRKIEIIDVVSVNSWTSPALENFIGKKNSLSGVIYMIVGTLCLIWLLVIIFGPFPSYRIFAFSNVSMSCDRKGRLVVYPTNYANDRAMKNWYLINLEVTPGNITESASLQLEKVISGDICYSGKPGMLQNVRGFCWVLLPAQLRRLCTDDYPPNSTESMAHSNCSVNESYRFSRLRFGQQCSTENNFGYNVENGTYSPCFLVRIEETEDWVPDDFTIDEKEFLEDYSETNVALVCRPRGVYGNKPYKKIVQSPAEGFSRSSFPLDSLHGNRIPAVVMVRVAQLQHGAKLEIECSLRVPNAFLLEDNGLIFISFNSNIP